MSYLKRSSEPGLGLARMMRKALIFFSIVVMSLTWLSGEYMGWIAQLVVTGWFGLFLGAGLLVLHRLERESVRERRRSAGCCVGCGYDLRASKDRCPECGMPITRPETLRERFLRVRDSQPRR